MVGGSWIVVALCPVFVAGPALARDGASGGTVSIVADGRAMLMAEASVHGGTAAPRQLPTLPGADTHRIAALVPGDHGAVADMHILPSIPAPPAMWHIVVEPPRMSRRDAAPIERMSLEGTTDYRRQRNFGLDARVELRLDGREDSAMLSLGGRLAGVIRTLERR